MASRLEGRIARLEKRLGAKNGRFDVVEIDGKPVKVTADFWGRLIAEVQRRATVATCRAD